MNHRAPNQLRPRLLSCLAALLAAAAACTACAAAAEKRYDPGASDTEIRIGAVVPFSGWAKEYGAVARAEAAYFQMVNERGGVNGRKINFISIDNGSDNHAALALAQRLVEKDQVLALFGTWGTEANLAIRGYANAHRIPQLFVESSSAQFDDPAHFPWTMGFFATFRTEGLGYAKYLLQKRPDARIAVLYDKSAGATELYDGIRDGLGDRAATMLVAEAIYRNTDGGDGAVDTQVEALQRSGADVFMNLAWGRNATAAISKAYDIGWHPLQFIPNASLSIAAFLEPAGLAKAAGIISNAGSKGWLRAATRADPAVRDFVDWMARYNPTASLRDQNNVAGYERAQALVAVLAHCGDDLTRANLMAQAAHLDLDIGMLRPGIRVQTSPTDYQPIKQLYLIRFDGTDWQAEGVVGGV